MGNLFFPLAVILATMMRDSRAGFFTAGCSILAYIGFGGAIDGFGGDAIPHTIVFFASIVGAALLQWYIELRFRQSLLAQYEVNASLEAEAERRRQAERELREQEKQLRRLAENASDLVMEIDQHGRISYASPSFQSVLRYPPQALIGKNAFDLVVDEERQIVQTTADGWAATHTPGLMQLRAQDIDGRIIHLEISGTPLYDDDRKHTGFVGTARDISARVQAERAEQESDAKFRNIIDALPLGIHLYYLQDDGQVVFSGYNPAANKILGVDHELLLGRAIEAAFPGLVGSDVPQRYRQVAETGEPWESKQISYDHGEISGAFDVHAFQTLPGKMAAVFADISERLRADEALRTSEETFSTAFKTSPDSININRLSDGMYLDVNQGFCALMGYERDEILGKTSLEIDIWVNRVDRERLVRGLLEHGVVENLEARFRRKSGDIGIGLMSARVIVIQGEQCILSITRDITVHIAAEFELRETHAKLEQAYEATLVGWARALELRERETANHSQRVVEQTLMLASMLGYCGEALVNIQRGAMLHDIGKVGVPDGILLKPGPLTAGEWVTMRQHVEFARELLNGIEYLHACMDIPCYHHERWDGSGYPDGLEGEDIPLPARIFAVVDVYDALTHDRPYRPAWSAAETRRYLREQRGKHFDPEIVDLFLRLQGTGSLGGSDR